MTRGAVLVTAVGGDIGWSVARILRASGYFERVIGCDASPDHASQTVLDASVVVPRAAAPEYLDAVERLIAREGAGYLIPIAEPEIERIYQAAQEGWRPAVLVMAGGRAIPIGLDKLATAAFIQGLGFPAPWTIPADGRRPPEFPCILKDRRGWGGKSLVHIEDEEALDYYAARHPRAVLQQLLLPDDQEYTCGVFRSHAGQVHTITFRRRLLGGVTGSATVVQDGAIETALHTLAAALELRGSINVQLRRTTQGPTIFEINPRFSSTVMFRHLLGFRDVLWSIDDLEGRDVGPYTPPLGTRVYRVFTEVVIPTVPPRAREL